MGKKIIKIIEIVKVSFANCYLFLQCTQSVTNSYNKLLKFNQRCTLFIVGSSAWINGQYEYKL